MPRTIRARIALWTGALSLVIVLAFGLFLYASLRFQLYRSVDENLYLRAQQLLATLDTEGGQVRFDPGAVAALDFADETAAHLYSPAGEVLDQLGDEDVPVAASLAGAPYRFVTLRFSEDEAGDDRELEVFRLLIVPVRSAGEVVAHLQIAQDIESVQEALSRLLQLLLLTGPAMVAAAALGGAWLAGRALAPIEKIRRQAALIQARDLHRRLDLTGLADEVDRLAQTFNGMLNRLEASFVRQRRFTADASHELRTPLAIIRGEIDVALARPRPPADYIATLQSVDVEARRMSRLVEELLLLARADADELRLKFEPFDLADLLRLLLDQLQPQAEAAGVALRPRLPAALPVVGDRDRLLELFINLLENAFVYAPGSQVEVRGQAVGDQAVVSVSDSGPGISAEHLPRVFERFYRVDPARGRAGRGSGLGLAIALEIAQAHGGEIAVDSVVGKGTTFTVRLPQPPSGAQAPL